jgi:hypothetical protein
MRICRIAIDLAYQDDADDAPKTERSCRALIDKSLDPALGEYMSCTTGVVVKKSTFLILRARARLWRGVNMLIGNWLFSISNGSPSRTRCHRQHRSHAPSNGQERRSDR